jgi:hypothetical protein
MPRRDKWQGISKRLGLSDTLIFLGKPATPEDYAFIIKHRNEIADADILVVPGNHDIARKSEAKEEPSPADADMLERKLKEHLSYIIAAARGDPVRLGWALEQMRIHLRKPDSWEEPETEEQRRRRLGLVRLQRPIVEESEPAPTALPKKSAQG